MKVLVLGASGATGRLLVAELLRHEMEVIAVVRQAERLPSPLRQHPRLTLIEGEVARFGPDDWRALISPCEAVVSCLGHNLTWRGLFGPPRRLVCDAVRQVFEAVRRADPSTVRRLILMSSAGVRHPAEAEPLSLAERAILSVLRVLLPPHADNESAAAFLVNTVGGHDPSLQWVIVRPDTLSAEAASAYRLFSGPTRSALFDPGRTRRIHVAQFMAELLTQPACWQNWQGRLPVVYDEGAEGGR